MIGMNKKLLTVIFLLSNLISFAQEYSVTDSILLSQVKATKGLCKEIKQLTKEISNFGENLNRSDSFLLKNIAENINVISNNNENNKSIFKEILAIKVTKENEQNKFPFYILLTGLFGALLGLSPYLIEKYKPLKIFGKIISFLIIPGQEVTLEKDKFGNLEVINGIGFRFNTHLIANKDLNLKKVKVFLQFEDDFIEGKLFFISNAFGSQKYEENIQFTPFMEANKSYIKYLTFVFDEKYFLEKRKNATVEKFKNSNFSAEQAEMKIIRTLFTPKKIKLIFQKYNGSLVKLILDLDDVDFASILPEE